MEYLAKESVTTLKLPKQNGKEIAQRSKVGTMSLISGVSFPSTLSLS